MKWLGKRRNPFWPRAQSRLIRAESYLALAEPGGQEHRLWLAEDGRRYFKATLEERFSFTVIRNPAGLPELANALPLEYLDRLRGGPLSCRDPSPIWGSQAAGSSGVSWISDGATANRAVAYLAEQKEPVWRKLALKAVLARPPSRLQKAVRERRPVGEFPDTRLPFFLTMPPACSCSIIRALAQ